MIIRDESEMLNFGAKVARTLKLPAVIELIGDVGAGKTTFTRGLAVGLGIKESITSPSFAISKRYVFDIIEGTAKNNPSEKSQGELVHYDFYRLDDPGIMQEEIAETLSQPNTVTVVEWGGDVAKLLPVEKLQLEIKLKEDGTREILGYK